MPCEFYKFVKTNPRLLQLFRKYRSVLLFILTFLGSYFVFSLFYNVYLEFSNFSGYYPDFFTHLVAIQSEATIEALGYPAEIVPHRGEDSVMVFINDLLLARIVEGCNSISVIILFTSFVLSFFSDAKSTLLFIVSGAVIIYVMNIVRIALLTIGIYEYPQYAEFMHSILFPLIIYGTVFILWIVWVRIFSRNSGNESKI